VLSRVSDFASRVSRYVEDAASSAVVEVFSRLFRGLTEVGRGGGGGVAFVDSGISWLASKTPVYVVLVRPAALIRRGESLRLAARDELLLAAAAVPGKGGGYSVKLEAELLGGRGGWPAESVPSVLGDIERWLNTVMVRFKSPSKLAAKALDYMIKSLELAYAVRALEEGAEASVVDGPLYRVFAERAALEGGGPPAHDIRYVISLLLKAPESRLTDQLERVIGLVKSVSGWRLVAYDLVLGGARRGAVDAAALDTGAGAVDAGSSEVAEAAANAVEKEVYRAAVLRVFRVPVSSCGRVFAAEVFTWARGVWAEGSSVLVDGEAAGKSMSRTLEMLSLAYSERAALTGCPPYGFMDVDRASRVPARDSRAMKQVLWQALRGAARRIAEDSEALRVGYR